MTAVQEHNFAELHREEPGRAAAMRRRAPGRDKSFGGPQPAEEAPGHSGVLVGAPIRGGWRRGATPASAVPGRQHIKQRSKT